MKIIIHTAYGDRLLKILNEKIEKGELKTWEIKRNKEKEILYNHLPEQWSDRVLLKPKIHTSGLQIVTVFWSNKTESDEATKGYIIGRFTEILMVHFRKSFSKLEIL